MNFCPSKSLCANTATQGFILMKCSQRWTSVASLIYQFNVHLFYISSFIVSWLKRKISGRILFNDRSLSQVCSSKWKVKCALGWSRAEMTVNSPPAPHPKGSWQRSSQWVFTKSISKVCWLVLLKTECYKGRNH